jgi:hypothetical protein
MVARWVDAFRSGRVTAVDMHHSGCFLSISVIEQCMDEDWHWPMKELAKHTGFHGSDVVGGKCFFTLSILPTTVHVTII